MRRLLALLALLCAVSLPALAAGPAVGATTTDHAPRDRTTTHRGRTTTHRGHTTTHRGRTARHHRTAAAHTTTAHGAVAGAASVAAGTAVINDCQDHGVLTKSYTKAELHEALAVMSAATKQYSDCESVIQNALAHGIKVGKGSGSGGSGGSSTTTIVIIVVVVLLLLAAIFGGLAVRRRRRGVGGGGETGESPTQIQPPPEHG